ncbi:MAG TPA: protein kinase, partial [Acidobacteriaceae bacterium]|nr:protein kinase [Acidobacteriaceae bacterium]
MDVTSTGKVGRYRVLRVLGRGGMGEVLLAEDEDLGRRVAIKRPFKSAMEDGLARFQVEAKAAILKHPNIPAVYEMGEQDGLPYIVMEFVEGEPLDKIISSGRPLELIAKLNIIRQVCLGLGHAHEKGIVHRDIKPANVIVQPDGVAKIIDFGIAKLTNLDVTQGLTQTQQIIGSLHYIAPERFRGETIDGRADIFSAGVMLYLLLTGHLPFGGSEVTASYKIVNEAHSSLKEHIRDYPPALDGIMDKALAKDPYDRYSTAEDFADALDEVIEELKKSRVGVLFDDAERLAAESRYAPALELLDQAIRLDPNNTQVKKLRKLLREHQERQKRAERTREFTNQADAALAVGNLTDALTALREAQRLDSSSVELRNRIQAIEEQKRRNERSQSALAEVESVRARGDVTGSLRLLDRALADDPENAKLLAARAVIVRQIENEAKQGQVLQLVEQARAEMAAQRVANALQKLREAEALDNSHPQVDELRRDLARIKEQDERRQLMEEIQRRVNEFLRADNYEGATDLLNRAIEKLPHEAALQRLKIDVDTEARKFDAKRFV